MQNHILALVFALAMVPAGLAQFGLEGAGQGSFNGQTLDLDFNTLESWSLADVQPTGAEKTAECREYLRLNVDFNADRFRDYCSPASLTVDDLERIAAAIRAEKRSCWRVADLRIQDYRQNHWRDETMGIDRNQLNRGPSGDFTLGLTWQFGTDRVTTRLGTPIGSRRWTLNEGRRIAPNPRRERHELIGRAQDIRRGVRDDARDLDLGGVGSHFTAENLATYGSYEAMRRAAREARSGAGYWERRAGEAHVDAADCERYWDSRLNEVYSLLGGRR